MPLIECPDCNSEVSSRAPACPKCGAPIAGAMEAQAAGAPLTTTQSTSKKLKLHSLMAGLLIIIGAILTFTNVPSGSSMQGASGPFVLGILLASIGLAWSIITKVRTWWHHG